MKKNYVIYNVTNDELNILKQEGFEFIEELPHLGSETWTVIFNECDERYFQMALNVILRLKKEI